MSDCAYISHPLRHQSGVSQKQRHEGAPDPERTRIDDRRIADFLKFASDFALQVNHYDLSLAIGDWSSFFKGSIPFTIAGIANLRPETLEEEYQKITELLLQENKPAHIQWLIDFFYSEVLLPWHKWQKELAPANNLLSVFIEKTISGELSDLLKSFIAIVNGVNKHFPFRKPDFQVFQEEPAWRLEITDLFGVNDAFIHAPGGVPGRIRALHQQVDALFSGFLENFRLLNVQASVEDFLDEEVLLENELSSKSHPPHLGLFYTFLRLYRDFQEGTNQLTKKHLDHFYQKVLCIQPDSATPDQAHIIFELQKFQEKYLLPRDTLVKDGKDLNKMDILFGLNEDIVVNKAQVASLKTLFLNPVDRCEPLIVPGTEPLPEDRIENHVQGLYMAPLANTLDGTGEPFGDEGPASWYTLGSRKSKQLLPSGRSNADHPFGRIGFVLASPVLLLNEGRREVIITLTCVAGEYSNIDKLQLSELNQILQKDFNFISAETFENAKKTGLSGEAEAWLADLLSTQDPVNIGDDTSMIDNEASLTASDKTAIITALETKRAFKVVFSGEKEWISPTSVIVNIQKSGADYELILTIILEPDLPAITFFDGSTLEEKLDTELPLAKIEVDQHVQISCDDEKYDPQCCLEKCKPATTALVSVYEYLRGLEITESKIDVSVCGLKNLILQNDENVMDVNGAIYPFGTRPDIADFTVVNPSKAYCISQDFIDDADAAGITNTTKSHLESLLGTSDQYFIGVTQQDRDDFVDNIPVNADKAIINALLNAVQKNYCAQNLEGPNFYIGSKEVFCKDWENVWININWKDKPSNFNEYYKAYVVNGIGATKVFGLNEDEFEINAAVRQDGQWYRETQNNKNIDHDPATGGLIEPHPVTKHNNRYLFRSSLTETHCENFNQDPDGLPVYEQTVQVFHQDFDHIKKFRDVSSPLEQFTVDARDGFLRLTLENQDFLHKDYAFVLARQMMAFGRFTGKEEDLIDDAVYEDTLGAPHVFNLNLLFIDLQGILFGISQSIIDDALDQLFQDIRDAIEELLDAVNSDTDLTNLLDATNDVLNFIGTLPLAAGDILQVADVAELKNIYDRVNTVFETFLNVSGITLGNVVEKVKERLEPKIQVAVDALAQTDILGNLPEAKKVLIPNEPYTPVIKDISLDYTACATQENIDLTHLYPYESTYLTRDITQQPTLLPVYTDEGSLFLGVENLVPGNNLNILFQLAETTADSEIDEAVIDWAYLRNNQWQPLRTGFEILDDDTDNLTRSGIIKIAVPKDMSLKGHTIMPDGLGWFRASAQKNVKAVAETLGIHTQAVQATFSVQENNDLNRLGEPLDAGSISKLQIADANVKKVDQPYASFNGKTASDDFYTRVSEHLHHKGRGIAAFGYERMVMNEFREVCLCKCIQHTHGLSARKYKLDLELAPGFVLLAVVADITQLPYEDRFAPELPVSKLNRIEDFLADKVSPFTRIKASNPRYEKINTGVRVVLRPGRDENYFREKLEEELRLFYSPWVEGTCDQLVFGRSVSLSSVLLFIESREYVDHVLELQMIHEEDMDESCHTKSVELCPCEGEPGRDLRKSSLEKIAPMTARSVLVAGEITIVTCLPACPEPVGECNNVVPFHQCEPVDNHGDIN